MMKTNIVRDLIVYLTMQCGDIDEECRVKVVKRDEDGCVIRQSVVKISYIDAYGNICVEFADIIKNETHYNN